MRRSIRILGLLLTVAGLAGAAWALVVWRWQDPVTYLYAKHEQARLADDYARRLASLPRPRQRAHPLSSAERELRWIRLEARHYRRESRPGEALGRIRIPRLDLDMILVNGTDHDSLTRGPGRDLRTFMPGEGQLVYVACHRTTYLAPFSHIERLERGDPVTIELPYATFRYRITRHTIVKATDLAVLRSPGYELLALQACHPRFSATHRYIAYARPVRVIPRIGRPLSLAAASRRTAQ